MPVELIVSLIATLANVLMNVLGSQGVVNKKLEDLVNQLISVGASLFNAFRNVGNVDSELKAVLMNLQRTLTTLKEDTTLDPIIISQLQEANRIVTATVQGFESGFTTTDPSTLKPLPPIE